MSWRSVTCESEAAAVMEATDWAHACVREMYLVAPSYVTADRKMVAPDCPPAVRVLVTSQDPEYPGVELFFDGVSRLGIWCGGELSPSLTVDRDKVRWSFQRGIQESTIEAKRARWRPL